MGKGIATLLLIAVIGHSESWPSAQGALQLDRERHNTLQL